MFNWSIPSKFLHDTPGHVSAHGELVIAVPQQDLSSRVEMV
jgi:hypothetical protein